MEAKALTTQDLTTDLTTNSTAVSLDAVALDAMALESGALDSGALDAAALAVAATPAPQVTELPEGIAGELVTTEPARAGGHAFEEFGVAEPICAALAAAGITTAFPIQALTLPIALEQHDVIGQAR